MANQAITARVESLLTSEHFDEAVRATIVALGDDALDALTDIASDTRASGERRLMKSRAILALADWPDRAGALDTLAAVIDQSDTNDRLRATIALGEMGTDAAVQQLSAFAERADNDIERLSIVRALQASPAESARYALTAMQAQPLSAAVQAEIAAALDEITQGH